MKKILFMIMTVLGWINLTSCNEQGRTTLELTLPGFSISIRRNTM